MKTTIACSFVMVLMFSFMQFDLQSTFGAKIDYKKIYKNRCQKCHGMDGNGTKRGKKLGAPDFTDSKWQASVTDEQLINSITNGKKKMPKQKGTLSSEEIEALVKYVRFFTPKKKRKY